MDHLKEKIELLTDQINNLEKSGFYTEADMDRLTKPYRLELVTLISKLPTQSMTKTQFINTWDALGRDMRNLSINKG